MDSRGGLLAAPRNRARNTEHRQISRERWEYLDGSSWRPVATGHETSSQDTMSNFTPEIKAGPALSGASCLATAMLAGEKGGQIVSSRSAYVNIAQYDPKMLLAEHILQKGPWGIVEGAGLRPANSQPSTLRES